MSRHRPRHRSTASHQTADLQTQFASRKTAVTGRIQSIREISGASPQDDKIERETPVYVTSLVWLAHQIGPVIRSHWAVENSLHWVMDIIFRDDECRLRKDHAPANFTTLKHMAHNLIRKPPGKDSLSLRRKVAASDDDFLANLIAA